MILYIIGCAIIAVHTHSIAVFWGLFLICLGLNLALED